MQWVDGVGLSTGLNGGQAEYVNVPMADLTLQPIPEVLAPSKASY